MQISRALIIGGGIGGMSLAAALCKVGIEAHVYERAPEINEVGAGIALWPNARACISQLGAAERAVQSCAPLHKVELMSSHGKVLSHSDLAAEWPDVSDAVFHIVHRADLLAALTEQVPKELIHTGHACSEIEQTADGVRALFDHHQPAEGDVLIGADGINSLVRRKLVGADRLRYSGQTCFRGVTSIKIRAADVLREIQGPGQRCGVCPIGKDRVYFWAAYNAPASQFVPQEQRRAVLLSRYRNWPGEIAEVIAATPTDQILQNDLCDRIPIRSWSRGRATLLGDAAHPTTPNLGQGANMAIDDALVLARSLRQAQNVAQAFADYEAIRRARSAMIVWRSWGFGVMCRWQSPAAVRLREALICLTPKSLMRAELHQQIFERVPPLA